jgi:hypothetical protein
MARAHDPRRWLMPVDDWPIADQTLWQAAKSARGQPLSTHSYVRSLRDATIGKAARGYGRWLTFLDQRGELDPHVRPSTRVTPERLNAYFAELLDQGCADHTVVGRIAELTSALRIMEPRFDPRWILTPGGAPLREYLAMHRRPVPLHHPVDLFLWGLDLMQEARGIKELQRRGPQLRDGLLIALEALRGLRLRSVHSLTLGRSILRDGDTGLWRLDIPPEEVKNHRRIAGEITAILAPWFDRYTEVERAEMLAGRSCAAFWVSLRGDALSESGLTNALVRRSAARFGVAHAFRSHRFRHCLGSTLPLLVPEHPHLASQLLAISYGVASGHYDRSADVLAFRRYHAALDAERERHRLPISTRVVEEDLA